jgi:hypothetical protein
MVEEISRLIWDWQNEKHNIESFLADPLKWVANELERVCNSPTFNLESRKLEIEQIKTLIGIIRFIDGNRHLLPQNKQD